MHNAGYLREEPGAGKPHARICEGESQMAELLDHDLRASTTRACKTYVQTALPALLNRLKISDFWNWRPQGDSNPCYRRERVAYLGGLSRGGFS